MNSIQPNGKNGNEGAEEASPVLTNIAIIGGVAGACPTGVLVGQVAGPFVAILAGTLAGIICAIAAAAIASQLISKTPQ